MKPSARRRSKTRASRRTSAAGHSSSRRSSVREVESWAAALVAQSDTSRTARRAIGIIGVVSSPGQELPQARIRKYTANTRKRSASAHAPIGPAFWMTQRNPMTSKSTGLVQWARSAPNAQTAEKAANQMPSTRYARDGVRVIGDPRFASWSRPLGSRLPARRRCDAKHDHAVGGRGGGGRPPEEGGVAVLGPRRVGGAPGARAARQRLHPHLQRRSRLGDQGP